MLQLMGLIRLTQILEMFVKAIFDEPTERTNWPSSQQNLNVNEDVFGTQVEQQLQDNYKMVQFVLFVFHVVSCISPQLQNCQCSTAAGYPLPGVTSVYAQICRNCSF